MSRLAKAQYVLVLGCVVLLSAAGCTHAESKRCGFGLVCPPGTLCHDGLERCVTTAQQEACAGLTDGDFCHYADVLRATCDMGVCLPAACGNGRLDPGERCDDGNLLDGDGCAAHCESDERCGNGIVDGPAERCDCGADEESRPDRCQQPNGAPGARCSAVCQLFYCGNAILDPGEVCDDGNYVTGDGCGPDCQSTQQCGNGIVDALVGETCDDGNLQSNDGCSAVCRLESCGNGQLDLGEVCDDGNNAAGDGCDPSCLSTEVCGNGVVDDGNAEQCDCGVDDFGLPTLCIAPNGHPDSLCSHQCRLKICGDGVVSEGEVCDDGNLLVADGCTPDCLSDETCGNGRLDAAVGESCDCGTDPAALPTGCAAPNGDAASPCTVSCEARFCGNGVVDPWEACDDDNTQSGDGCRADCFSDETCGNGRTDLVAGETCDCGTDPSSLPPGCPAINGAPGGPCGPTCRQRLCGNGVLETGEQCDDGNTAWGDGCAGDCRSDETCGNSVVDVFVGEQCDDGNLQPGDGCSASCLQERCGNGLLETGEQCDDGNAQSGDGCSAFCTVEVCGNGIVDAGETCDNGPTNGVSPDACTVNCQLTVCGDNHQGGAEVCDGTQLAGATCPSQGYHGGWLGCQEDCQGFVESFCFLQGDGVCDSDVGESHSGSPLDCGFIEVSGGRNHSCAVRADGSVACWGRNVRGQLGVGDLVTRLAPTAAQLPRDAHVGSAPPQVVNGSAHSCVLRTVSSGPELWCWGQGNFGQLGNGTQVDNPLPSRAATALGDLAQVAAGDEHMCAVPAPAGPASWLYCWGKNTNGQLGVGVVGTDALWPVPIDHGPGAQAVALGGNFSCAQLTGGDLYCWGDNYFGQLGDGSGLQQPSAVLVADATVGLITTRQGLGFGTTVTASGLWRWGRNDYGQLADPSLLDAPQPVNTPGEVYDVLELGAFHACGVRNDQVYCWGRNEYGQLGDGTTADNPVPQPVLSLLPGETVRLGLGNNHSCIVRGDGRIQCWGSNDYGQVGDNTGAGPALQPTDVLMP